MPVRRLFFAVIVPVVLLVATFATTAWAAPTAAAADSATLAQYRQWIAEARAQYPYPETTDRMYRVMMCESVGDRFAVGGGRRWFGLFQYVPSTWRGTWNPYRTADIYDAKSQIFATARAWQLGKQGEWTCYRLTR